MSFYSTQKGFSRIDELAKENIPFLFILSFDKTKLFVQRLDELDSDIFYKLNEKRNYRHEERSQKVNFIKSAISFKNYKEVFNRVQKEIRSGNTYLLNLTFSTSIESELPLLELFKSAKAKYKLYFKGEFICFSPECFIEINGEEESIYTYPMKGTIDASIERAEERILSDEKEMAEHVMIVDLMRNDLAIVAEQVKVDRFRYIEEIHTGDKDLLQVSSKISAKLPSKWRENLGQLLNSITPAGSISGTPKKSTLNIIKNLENDNRGFYTGIFGIYENKQVDSAVIIRYIEEKDSKLYYRSGGGITIESKAILEYEELINKIYLPID